MSPRWANPAADLLVLCYHAISDRWPSPLAVTTEALHAQITSLLDRGYRPCTFSEAMYGRPSEDTFVVTFDDGYRSVIDDGLPILASLGTPATVFVPTDFVATELPMRWPGISQWLDGPHEHELMPMNWHELRRLVDAGWEVGSHTCSHPALPELSDERLRSELLDSRMVCERELGRPCLSIAYPFGRYDPRVVAAAGASGYATGAGLRYRRWCSGNALCRPRVGVMRGDEHARFRRTTSRTRRRLAASPAWPVLEPAMGWVVTGLRTLGLRR